MPKRLARQLFWPLLRRPRVVLERLLATPRTASYLLVMVVAPLGALRPAAELIRSLLGAQPGVGIILAIGSFMLHGGTWLAVSLALPAIARQFSVQLDERRTAALVTYAMVPWWLVSVLYVVPESPLWLQLWSRFLVFLGALYGLRLLHIGAAIVQVPKAVRVPFVLATGIVAFCVYALLFLSLGLGASILLYILG